jgi:hypothetical protein
MARIEWVHQRLLNWQRWMLTQGGGVLGYAAVNLADPTPGVLEPYAEAPVPTNDIEAGDTNDAVQRLPSELKATVLVKYLGKLEPDNRRERYAASEQDQLLKLGCGRSTLHARIERAQRLLADHFEARRTKRANERQRVEALIERTRPVE